MHGYSELSTLQTERASISSLKTNPISIDEVIREQQEEDRISAILIKKEEKK